MTTQINPKVKKFLEENALERKRVSISISKYYQEEILRLSIKHNVTFSAMIEACICVGLTDPYINSSNKEENKL